jgi:hypothetical protein
LLFLIGATNVKPLKPDEGRGKEKGVGMGGGEHMLCFFVPML